MTAVLAGLCLLPALLGAQELKISGEMWNRWTLEQGQTYADTSLTAYQPGITKNYFSLERGYVGLEAKFSEKALGGSKVVASAQLLASNNAIATTVGSTPGGIGYIGLGYLTDQIRTVTVNKVSPNTRTVQEGTYPLARKLYMYTNGKAKGDVNNYIAFIQSAEGQKIVVEQGFISLK